MAQKAAHEDENAALRVYPACLNVRHSLKVSPVIAPPLVVIVGPTAVGKTTLGIDLAIEFDGEVVNADSRYLYRGFDIGVAKPSLAERRGVPHHLIDICEPADEMSVVTYQELAFAAIDDVLSRGRLPLLVGGTPLYVNAVVENWQVPRVPPDWELRKRLEREIGELGLEAVAARLGEIDPTTAARSGRNARRVIRALEIYEATGQPMSAQEGKLPPRYRTLELRLTLPRDQLYAALDRRIDDQLARGLLKEVRGLLTAGVQPDLPAMSSLGYRQLIPVIEGRATLAEAVATLRTDTRRYVRHQETWLRRNPRLIPIAVDSTGWKDESATIVRQFLTNDETSAPIEP